jgi:transcriptional antiterminator RfaH
MTDMEHEVGPATSDQPDADPRNCPCVNDLSGRWWVLHTKPRNEKAIAAVLDRRGVDYFLPLVRHQRRIRGRIRYVDLPLFPSYLFLCGDWKSRETALKTNRVAKVLEVPDQEQLKADLKQIERVLDSGEPVDLYPALKAGARCRVRSGVLAGLEGVVLRRKGPWRVYVAVQFIAQSAELELDSAMLEVID